MGVNSGDSKTENGKGGISKNNKRPIKKREREWNIGREWEDSKRSTGYQESVRRISSVAGAGV